MMPVTLSMKTVVIAGALIVGSAATFVLVANGRGGETAVAGSQITAGSDGGSASPTGTRPPTPQSRRGGDPPGPPANPPGPPADPPAPPASPPRNDGNGNSDGDGTGRGGGTATATFQITGSVAGLHPNAGRPLDLTFDNPAPFRIRVTELEVLSADSDRVGCTKENLVTPSDAVDIDVPGGASATHTVFVGMVADADNSCQGATWALTYTATAVKA